MREEFEVSQPRPPPPTWRQRAWGLRQRHPTCSCLTFATAVLRSYHHFLRPSLNFWPDLPFTILTSKPCWIPLTTLPFSRPGGSHCCCSLSPRQPWSRMGTLPPTASCSPWPTLRSEAPLERLVLGRQVRAAGAALQVLAGLRLLHLRTH